MKLKTFLGLVFAAALFFSTPTEAKAVSVGLTVLDDYIKVGESFSVEVWAYGEGINEDLISFGFDVNVPGQHFRYNGYAIDPTTIWDTPNPLVQNCVAGGNLNYGVDDILLATLNFTAINAGTELLGIDGSYDGLFYGLMYPSTGVDICASTGITVNPVPEPTSLLLLGCGLIAFAGLGRKKFTRS